MDTIVGKAFQSTRPMRGATPEWDKALTIFSTFQSTRPMRGATYLEVHYDMEEDVSIHAPHAERDIDRIFSTLVFLVSIHAPHAGRDRQAAI